MNEDWHLEKKISVGHILTTMTIAISAVWWASSIEKRVEKNRQAITYLQERHNELLRRIDANRIEMRVDLKDINKKLDRINERLK